jgi:hypothetical protein
VAECSVPDCGRPMRSRGWCITHYRRWEKHGDVLAHIPVKATKPRQLKPPKRKALDVFAWLDLDRLVRTNPLSGWHRYAACKGESEDRFFNTGGNMAPDVRAMCEQCPARYACLAETLRIEEGRYRHGHYAGTTRKDRDRIADALARRAA